MQPTVICVLAHQDDEYGLSARLRFEVKRGKRVVCIYLTNGASSVAPNIRDAETRLVLESYGLPSESIIFWGSENGVHDGDLLSNLDKAADAVYAVLAGENQIEAIYTLAWEGGHPDHDCSHIITLAAACRLGMLDKCWEFPVYTSAGIGRLYRVMKPLHPEMASARRLSFREAFFSAMQCWRYPSQRKTWCGLFPEAFLRWMLLRRETLARIDPKRVRSRPHKGPLLYERMFGMPHDVFMRVSRPIRERVLEAAGVPGGPHEGLPE